MTAPRSRFGTRDRLTYVRDTIHAGSVPLRSDLDWLLDLIDNTRTLVDDVTEQRDQAIADRDDIRDQLHDVVSRGALDAKLDTPSRDHAQATTTDDPFDADDARYLLDWHHRRINEFGRCIKDVRADTDDHALRIARIEGRLDETTSSGDPS